MKIPRKLKNEEGVYGKENLKEYRQSVQRTIDYTLHEPLTCTSK